MFLPVEAAFRDGDGNASGCQRQSDDLTLHQPFLPAQPGQEGASHRIGRQHERSARSFRQSQAGIEQKGKGRKEERPEQSQGEKILAPHAQLRTRQEEKAYTENQPALGVAHHLQAEGGTLWTATRVATTEAPARRAARSRPALAASAVHFASAPAMRDLLAQADG
jgi:hypothetical protein